MKIKSLIGSLLLLTGMAFGQSQFQGGGGSVGISGTITNGHCTQWIDATHIGDAGGSCTVGGSGINITVNGGGNLVTPANFQNGTAGNVINFSNPSGSNVQATLQATSVTNAMLVNNSITIGGTSVALGGSTSSFPSPGAIGGTTPSTGAFTTLSATSTVSGAGFTALFASPPPIGTTAAAAGAFTTLSATGQITSTLATGTAPFSIASTTVVPNLNASLLLGNTWAAPGAIGGTTPGAGSFTTGSFSGALTTNMTSGPFCVHETSGVLSATTADCGSGGGGSPTLSAVTGSAAQATGTEVGVGDNYTFAGVETGNLTSYINITNFNSSNNNTSVGLLAGVTGSSTGGIGAVIYDISGTGDIFRAYVGGSVSNGVYTPGTLEASITAGGVVNATTGFQISGAAPIGQVLSSNGSSFVGALPGVPVDATNPSTLLSTDRATWLNWTSGSALALPAISGTFASNFPFRLRNTSGGTLTITPNAGNSDLCNGSATCTLLNNWDAFVYQDSTTAPGHWFTVNVPTSTAFPACADTLGNHLNFTTAAGFTCGTTAAPAITAFWSPAATQNNAMGATTQNTTRVWAFYLPTAIASSTAICYQIQATDNTADVYDVGLYSSAGILLVHTGATAGTTLFAAGGPKCANWASSAPLPVDIYALALTSSAAAPTAQFGGATAASIANFWAAGAATGGGTSGGALNGSITFPTTSWAGNTMVNFSLH